MLDYMIALGERLRPPLLDLFREPRFNNFAQGALLEVDEFWLSFLLSRVLPRQSDRQDGRFLSLADWAELTAFKPPVWTDYCKTNGRNRSTNPFRIRVLLRQQLGGYDLAELDLPDHFGEHPLVYEVRPPAVAASALRRWWNRRLVSIETRFEPFSQKAHKVSRGVDEPPGTLGGYFRCPLTDRVYVVSCAHVLGTQGGKGGQTFGPIDHRWLKPTALGSVTASALAPRAQGGQTCDPTTITPLASVDYSLVNMDRSLMGAHLPPLDVLQKCLPVRGAEILARQRVQFVGAKSGHVRAMINSTAIWIELYFDDFDGLGAGYRCFGGLAHIADPWGGMKGVADRGDSGAWIVEDGAPLLPPRWVGMVIAAQRPFGYACLSQFVLASAAEPAGKFPFGVEAYC